jgi:hypothetical protein
MQTRTKILGVVLLLATMPVPGQAQIGAQVSIDLAFPEPPPLVVVSPGVQVVPEYEEEVFFTNNWYWVRRDGAWFRTRDYRGGWVPVRPRYVPVFLNRAPPGHYSHYFRDDDGRWRPHQREEFHAWRERHPMDERRQWWGEHRNDPRMRQEQDRAWRDQQRAERDHQRNEMQQQRMEQDRMRRERDRENREHGREMRDQEHARREQERAGQQQRHEERREHEQRPDQRQPQPQQQQQDPHRDGREHGRH